MKSLWSLVLLTLVFAARARAAPPAQFVTASLEGLKLQQSAHARIWHLGEEENWSADLQLGVVTFHFADGTRVTAPLQIIGTYDPGDGTFLWAWANSTVPEPLRRHALLAKKWGQDAQMPSFTSRKVKCSQSDALEFASVASRLANANGVYVGAGQPVVFITFGEVKIEKPKRK